MVIHLYTYRSWKDNKGVTFCGLRGVIKSGTGYHDHFNIKNVDHDITGTTSWRHTNCEQCLSVSISLMKQDVERAETRLNGIRITK